MRKLFSLFLGLIIVAGIQQSSYANDNENYLDKVSPALLSRFERHAENSVMIYLKNQSNVKSPKHLSKEAKTKYVFQSLQDQSNQSQKNLATYLEREKITYRSFYIINAIQAKVNSKHLEEIASMEEIAFISYDSPVSNDYNRIEKKPSAQREGTPEWGLQIIQADKVWEMGINGENVVVGGQDTGYDWTHPAIKSRYRGYLNEDEVDHNYNWHDAIHEISPLHNDSIIDPSNNPCGLDVDYPCADGGHGTHTMGTMVGLDENNIIGVAPGAKWVGVRNMERGWGKPSTYIESFEWFLAPTDLNGENPDPSLAPHVINNSWSCPLIEGCDASNWKYMDMAINNLREAGVVVVVSASNNGNACGRINAPPGMTEGTFSVAATRLIDTMDGSFIDDIAGYSSWGPVLIDSSFRLKPDIAAPGSGVRSCIPGNNYGTSSGTSMAGPHVAGLVALVISANPSLAGQVDEIEEIIQMTADPKTKNDTCGNYIASEIPNFVFGYGRINALKAVQAALLFTNTSTEANNAEEILIYPNPADDKIRIDWNALQLNANIKIIDQQGRIQAFMNISKGQKIDISSLSAGFYILKILINDKIISRKFIKQHSF